MEEIGIISPVVSVTAQFKTMTKFYDTVVIGLKISKYTGVRLEFEYEVKDAVTGEIRCTGKS
jgi:acyl-CoA thioester hydrolase